MKLGFLPRMSVKQMSETNEGCIYVPMVNFFRESKMRARACAHQPSHSPLLTLHKRAHARTSARTSTNQRVHT